MMQILMPCSFTIYQDRRNSEREHIWPKKASQSVAVHVVILDRLGLQAVERDFGPSQRQLAKRRSDNAHQRIAIVTPKGLILIYHKRCSDFVAPRRRSKRLATVPLGRRPRHGPTFPRLRTLLCNRPRTRLARTRPRWRQSVRVLWATDQRGSDARAARISPQSHGAPPPRDPW